MNIIQSRAKPFESVISIFLLICIVLIGVGVFVKQFDYKMSQFGMDVKVEGLSAKPSSATERIALNSLSAAGFKTLLGTEVYNSQTLYEKINGKAPIYLESGFSELTAQRFVSTKNEKIWAELFVYDMASAKNAYSVYSRQKRPDAAALPEMGFAYEVGNALFFAYGQYYIEFVGSIESKELAEAMHQIAREFISNATIADLEIDQMKLFTRENFIPGSIKLYLNSAFGFDRLNDIFTAQYKIGSDMVTAFLSERPSAEEAKVLFQQYHKFLLDNGGTDIEADDPAIKIIDFYGTIEIIGIKGRYLFGIHEADNRRSAEEVAGQFRERLSE